MPRDDEDEIPTPKQTGSWAISIGRSQALITRLARARVAYCSANPIQRDLDRAKLCEEHVVELYRMIARFERWPTAPRDEIEAERGELLIRLSDLTRATDALCARLGKTF